MQNKRPTRNKRPIIIMLIIYAVIALIGVIFLFPYVQETIIEYFSYNVEQLFPIFWVLLAMVVLCLSMLAFLFFKDKPLKDNKMGIRYYGSTSTSSKQEYLEREIAELSARLVATDDKWKDAYYLLLSSQNRQTDISGVVSTSRFLKGFGIDVDNITIKNSIVFVLTPFHPDFENTYDIIQEACQSLKLTAMRSDEEYIQTDIMKHIVKCIVEARVVIANIDGQNTNVFYELGIAHALNKPTILVSRANASIPFDVQSQYVIRYNSNDELKIKIRESLLKILINNGNS